MRRGDFLDQDRQLLLPTRYYDETVERVRRADPSTQFLIFSDDIEWCRAHIRVPDAVYVAGNPDWLDLALMAECDHHICANSTFSWWGAYLSLDSRPIVPWVVGGLPESFRIRHPPGWREIEVTAGADPSTGQPLV